MQNMKNVTAIIVIAYAITLAAPRTMRDVSTICLKAAALLAELGIFLHPPGTWHDGQDADNLDGNPSDSNQDA